MEKHTPKSPLVKTTVSSSLFIGDYKIEQIDEENFKVTKKYNNDFFNEATICGGDFETLLSCLFIRQEIKYTCYDRVMKTDIVNVEKVVDEIECDNPHCIDGFVETPYGHVYGNLKCSICEDKRDAE